MSVMDTKVMKKRSYKVDATDSDWDSDLDGPRKKKQKRQTKPTCRLCKNHNVKVRSRFHKKFCLGEYCVCELCVEKRTDRDESAGQTKKTREITNTEKREKRKERFQYGRVSFFFDKIRLCIQSYIYRSCKLLINSYKKK